ncbi:MAG: cytochrome c oxidase subunit 3 [Isosphaeraceae bacterium]
MADATASPTLTQPAAQKAAHSRSHHAPVTPGKVAMWLFLATEVMFFTGLIGSYIVLRSGSSSTSYTNLYPPTTTYKDVRGTYGVVLESAGKNPEQVGKIIQAAAPELKEAEVHEIVTEAKPAAGEVTVVNHLTESKAKELAAQLKEQGAVALVEPVVPHNWPKPYDRLTNPLSINLTAINTFVLICSSVTMVLALSGMQQGSRKRCLAFLGLTILFGSIFLSIQIHEYYELMVGRHYPPGISPTGHFRPSVSLFASCFFTMTGFHGLHVAGGVITLLLIFIQTLRGVFTQTHYNPIEFAGLYWHFVDLVWIILFTIVYLI